MKEKEEKNNNIVFYDGNCGLCDTLVQFILKNEKCSVLKFSSLQSEFANNFLLKKHDVMINMNTMYFFTNNKLHKKSNASLLVSKYLKKPYSFASYFLFTPAFLRDWLYDRIANNRKKFFPSKSCLIIPNNENHNRFLD